MSSAPQQPTDQDVELEAETAKETIRRILGTAAQQALDAQVTRKDALEDYIDRRTYNDHVQPRLDDAFPDLTETVDDDLGGDGRTRGLSDVLPPDGPRTDVYQYVPRRELREYTYVCENTKTRQETTWSVSGKERIEIEKEIECSGSFTRECRGLPAKCSRCGGWVRPEDDK